VYGAAASFVVFLVWVDHSAQNKLFGAELTQVYTFKFGPRSVERSEIAQRSVECLKQLTRSPDEVHRPNSTPGRR
jgi:uncharacterized BrkB/YihY/UPF0761 family membrane protein